jgi:hypothetical protein
MSRCPKLLTHHQFFGQRQFTAIGNLEAQNRHPIQWAESSRLPSNVFGSGASA